jgi:glutamate--cysteine ligase catalytic subunit
VKQAYFDTVQYKVDQEHMELLQKEEGIDERLAYHVSSLLMRDPIPTYDHEHEDDGYDPKQTTAHFENLQSTNWNSMRFKPPPTLESPIGWRVEFRTMDI